MVFYVRTRKAFDQLVELLGRTPSPLWVDRDVLSETEIEDMRASDLDVTRFTVEPNEVPDTEVIRLHHPDEVIWVQF